MPSLIKFRFFLGFLTGAFLTSACTISDKQAIAKLEEKFAIIRDEIYLRKSEKNLFQYPVYKYHKYLGKGSASSPAMKKLITPELMDYVNKNHHSLFEKTKEVRIFPSAGARIFALDNEFRAGYVWEKLNTGKSTQTFNRVIFMFLDFVFIYKDHLILLENDFADRKLTPIHKISTINYNTGFRDYNPETIQSEFIVSVSEYGAEDENRIRDTLDEKYLSSYLTSRKLVHKTRELIRQDVTEQTLKNSRYLQINYSDFFKWEPDDQALVIKRLHIIWVDNWLSDRASEIIKYLDSDIFITDINGLIDSTEVLKEISDLYFPFAILRNYGWVFGALDRSKYYLFQSMEGKPQLTGLVKFTGVDSLFENLSGTDINFDGLEDLAYTVCNDSLHKTLSFFMISKNENYKFKPGGIDFCNMKILSGDKIIVTRNYSVKDHTEFHVKFFKWENDSLRLAAQGYSKTSQNKLDVTLCINNNCDTKSYSADSLKGKAWDKMMQRMTGWPPEW